MYFQLVEKNQVVSTQGPRVNLMCSTCTALPGVGVGPEEDPAVGVQRLRPPKKKENKQSGFQVEKKSNSYYSFFFTIKSLDENEGGFAFQISGVQLVSALPAWWRVRPHQGRPCPHPRRPGCRTPRGGCCSPRHQLKNLEFNSRRDVGSTIYTR